MHTTRLIASSIAGLACAAMAYGWLAQDMAPAEVAVPMGNYELGGGTSSKTVDSSAFQGGGGPATIVTGTFKNTTAHTVTDMTVSLKKKGTAGGPPSAQKVVVGGEEEDSSPTPAGDGQSATVRGLQVAGNGSGDFKITGINANGTSEMTVNLTPSYEVSIGGQMHETNAIGAFHFTPSSDFMRRGSEEVEHSVVMADIVNDWASAELTALQGSVLLPPGVSVSVEAVHLLDVQAGYAPVAGTSTSVYANQISVTGFQPLSHTGLYLLVLVLSESLDGARFRLTLTATFD